MWTQEIKIIYFKQEHNIGNLIIKINIMLSLWQKHKIKIGIINQKANHLVKMDYKELTASELKEEIQTILTIQAME